MSPNLPDATKTFISMYFIILIDCVSGMRGTTGNISKQNGLECKSQTISYQEKRVTLEATSRISLTCPLLSPASKEYYLDYPT